MEEPVERISARLEKSLCIDTEDSAETYSRLIQEAKDAARGGDMSRALDCFKQAYNICQSEKIRSRIQKIEEILAEAQSEDDDEFVDVCGSGLMLFKDLHDKLYKYQKEGVAFMYGLYRDKLKGGILADDMGLGKTIQVISFLSGMYDAEHIKTAILVMPTSLITNWTKEFAKWTPGMRVKEFHGTSKSERTRNLEKVQRRGGVIITTYNMLLHNWQTLGSYQGREFTWDYMILDEAHKIKSSSTKTAKSASAIPSKNRVLLTGTPVQNNLHEMWALFDFACQGALLGTAKTFKAEYENPITRAREKDATPGEKALGSRMSENLMAIISPHFLRRTKAEVQKKATKTSGSPQENGSQISEPAEVSGAATMPKLPRKNDLIVWTYLSQAQEDIYRQFLSLDHIQELLMTTKSPLAQLTILKKLCDHPRLLSAVAIAKLGLDENEPDDSETDSGLDIANVPDDTLIAESGKMVFLIALLERLREEGHRTLVFAHYRKVLDIIERILTNRGFKVMRMDGTVKHKTERERRITQFQSDSSYTVFLLTTQVGGVGITLTAADRVVIYDPSWNPATDAQAVDRAYRIGQKHNVVVYRLITCGTVEEKIYRRQVFKGALIRQNTGETKNPFRYFSKDELRQLFTLEDTRLSATQLQLQELHAHQRHTDATLDEHIAHLYAMEMFGISDHDLMFSVDVHQEEAPEDQEEHRYIEGRVQKAQELVKAESELHTQLFQNMASSTEPAWLRAESHREPRQRSHREETESPPAPRPHGSPDVMAVENLVHDVSLEKSTVDLTEEQSFQDAQETSRESKEEIHQKIKLEQLDHEDIVISDDETQENGQNHAILDESLNGLQNGNLSVNNLVIEDSFEEVMDTSVQKDNSQQNMKQNGLEKAVNGFSDSLVEEEMPKSSHRLEQSTCDDSLTFFTAEDFEKPQLNSSQLHPSAFHGSPLKNKRLSVLQSSFKTQNSSKSSNGPESFGGDFNLQLDEDSDMFSDHDMFNDEKKTEQDEREILSQLRLEGSFDVDKSLAEYHDRERSVVKDFSDLNTSENESIVATSKKRRVAKIYSDDEEEEEEQNGKTFDGQFPMLGASTPKAASKLNSSTNSYGAKAKMNTSVASRRSFVISLIEDLENPEEEEQENGEMSTERLDSDGGEEASEEMQESGQRSESSRDENLSEAEELNLEETEESETEPSGETLHTEGEEEEEEEEEDTPESVEQSTADAELSSNEQMEQFATEQPSGVTGSEKDPEDYDWLVQRGREHVHRGQQEEALGYFLRAIDMRPGDPEIQLLTIQLYRQLSQKK